MLTPKEYRKVHRKQSKEQREATKKMTVQEATAIRAYATPPYGFLINKLFYRSYEELDKAIEKSPEIEMTLYRGSVDNPKWKGGQTIQFERYTSCSFLVARAMLYGRALYILRNYKGHAAYSGREEEFILPRKTMWRLREIHEGVEVNKIRHPKDMKAEIPTENKINVYVFDFVCIGRGRIGKDYWKYSSKSECKLGAPKEKTSNRD
jgi:hypothetical protein